jgi:hypothetical protein
MRMAATASQGGPGNPVRPAPGSDLEQKRAIAGGRHAAPQHSLVTVDFNGQAEAPQLPPDGQVPGNGNGGHETCQEPALIPGSQVLLFVHADQPLDLAVQLERPARQHYGSPPEAQDRGTAPLRQEHASSLDVPADPALPFPVQANERGAHPQQEKSRQHRPQRDQYTVQSGHGAEHSFRRRRLTRTALLPKQPCQVERSRRAGLRPR